VPTRFSQPVIIQRKCSQRTGDAVIRRQVNFILGRALGGSRGNCWEYRTKFKKPYQESVNKDDTDLWVFGAKITFEKTKGRNDSDVAERQWENIVRFLAAACGHSKFGRFPWTIIDGVPSEMLEASEPEEPMESEIKDYATLEEAAEPAGFFDHIFERDPQIEVVLSAVQAYRESDFQNRFHTVLHGPPACGKSEILVSLGRMLGEENEAFLKVDATTTTEAGMARLLLDAATIPPVVIIEEIEKADERSLRWLLGVLDQRAEIRRINARIGNRARNVQLLCLATANDMNLFRRVMSGALASRFSHEVYCPRPSRTVLERILRREVAKHGGREEWIEPTLKYCVDDRDMNDPRKIIPICMCGRDALLDGSYQKTLDAIRTPPKPKPAPTPVPAPLKF
jgi:hypothetical protein